jgi:hypothetical protein
MHMPACSSAAGSRTPPGSLPFLTVLIALFLLGSAFFAAAQTDGSLTSLRAVFEREKREIDAAYEKSGKDVAGRYVEDLKSVIRYMEQSGDEFGVAPAREESARFEREKTIPEKAEAGTPELIVKARERHRGSLKPAADERNRKLDALVGRYVNHLAVLQKQHEAGGRAMDAAAVAGEIRRAQGAAGSEDGSAPGVSRLVVQRGLMQGLALAYELRLAQNNRLSDLSGRRNSGRVLIGQAAGQSPEATAFTKFPDMITLERPLLMGGYWTLLLDVQFPLGGAGKQRVLASGGFRADHVAVSADGMLGVGADQFTGSGFNVNTLKGWRRIVAVGQYNRTLFYVDGKPAGAAQAACREKLSAFANSAGSGQPLHGALRTVAAWERALTQAEVEALPERLVPE